MANDSIVTIISIILVASVVGGGAAAYYFTKKDYPYEIGTKYGLSKKEIDEEIEKANKDFTGGKRKSIKRNLTKRKLTKRKTKKNI
jgi:hypothetical protein